MLHVAHMQKINEKNLKGNRKLETRDLKSVNLKRKIMTEIFHNFAQHSLSRQGSQLSQVLKVCLKQIPYLRYWAFSLQRKSKKCKWK